MVSVGLMFSPSLWRDRSRDVVRGDEAVELDEGLLASKNALSAGGAEE